MRSLTVAIVGGSGSGKSTLARAVAASLGGQACVISHDRYYRTIPDDYRDRPHDWDFDDPDTLDTDMLVNHLSALRNGREVVLPRYDFATHSREAYGDRLEPCPVVFIEGILLMAHPFLPDLFDLIVYVDAPDQIRLERRVQRDVYERGRDESWVRLRWDEYVHPAFVRWVTPGKSRAHLVVDGTQPVERGVASIFGSLARWGFRPTKHRAAPPRELGTAPIRALEDRSKG